MSIIFWAVVGLCDNKSFQFSKVSIPRSRTILTSTSFGEFKKNIWVPKDISGLSNQDFYLKFSDANYLGTDSSGNSRNWTVNGCGVDHKSLNTPTSDG